MTEAKQWYTTEQAANILGVHIETVRRLLRAGKIPGARKVGRAWRIPSDWILPTHLSR